MSRKVVHVQSYKKTLKKNNKKKLDQHTASQPTFKVNNGNTRTICEICSKLTIKTPARHHWRQICNFIKKETPTQLFSCEFCETVKNSFFHRTRPVAASEYPCGSKGWVTSNKTLGTTTLNIHFKTQTDLKGIYHKSFCTVFKNFGTCGI